MSVNILRWHSMQPGVRESELIISPDFGKNSLVITITMRESTNDSEKAFL